MAALMWFRSDLRIHDNPALHEACRTNRRNTLAVFAICPDQWREHDWGAMKVDFILRNLHSLSDSLAKLGIPLRLIRTNRFTDLPPKLLNLARRHKCTSLFFNKEYETNELARDQAVTALFERSKLQVQTCTDQIIIEPHKLRTSAGKPYTVFTPFKRKWCKTLSISGPPTLLSSPRKTTPTILTPIDIPNTLKGFSGHIRPDLWPAGEKHAHRLLRNFLSRQADTYHINRDLPGADATSTLSPYLAAGVLSPRQCMVAAYQANDNRLDSVNSGIAAWINELIWREFYRHVLIGFPHVGRNLPFRLETDHLPWRTDTRQFEAWATGHTGVPIVDAGMRQLLETGWMHNRLRMIVAMFLTKDLFIDWRWGQEHFMRHLIDGDFASNNGGWQWSASTGTDAAPYFRLFNPSTQSRRFDSQGEFIRRYVNELKQTPTSDIHEPHKSKSPPAKYPAPIADHRQASRHVAMAFKSLPQWKAL